LTRYAEWSKLAADATLVFSNLIMVNFNIKKEI